MDGRNRRERRSRREGGRRLRGGARDGVKVCFTET